MEDMDEKIRSILSDEESMKQISELAEMLSAGMDSSQSGPPNFKRIECTDILL